MQKQFLKNFNYIALDSYNLIHPHTLQRLALRSNFQPCLTPAGLNLIIGCISLPLLFISLNRQQTATIFVS